jgi:phage terminase large subunit-like protein
MTVEFTLADFQDDFVHGDAEAIAIIAGKGAGKTFSGALFVLNQIIEQPGSQGLVMLNTLQQTRDIYVQEIESKLKELNWQYSFNQQTMILKVFDCVIHLRSAEITAIEKIESVAYSWGWADEASFYEPKALETFVSRIRKGKALKRITSMPDEPDASCILGSLSVQTL